MDRVILLRSFQKSKVPKDRVPRVSLFGIVIVVCVDTVPFFGYLDPQDFDKEYRFFFFGGKATFQVQ